MRDPNRIDKVLNTIRFFWKKNPDLRLTQMVLNLAGDNEDVFYMEEDELLERLNKLYSDTLPRNQPFQDYGEE
jgi:uncharacterized protein YihD (DUF1040 family)